MDFADAPAPGPLDLITGAEVTGLLSGNVRSFGRDTARLETFLQRLTLTLNRSQETIAGLQRQLQKQTSTARVGQPTTLNPMDAVRYLSDEQMTSLFTKTAQSQITLLRKLVAGAQQSREMLLATHAGNRAVLEGLLTRSDVPSDVRSEAARLLSGMPVELPSVHYPPMLDYPDQPQQNTQPTVATPSLDDLFGDSPAPAPAPAPATNTAAVPAGLPPTVMYPASRVPGPPLLARPRVPSPFPTTDVSTWEGGPLPSPVQVVPAQPATPESDAKPPPRRRRFR